MKFSVSAIALAVALGTSVPALAEAPSSAPQSAVQVLLSKGQVQDNQLIVKFKTVDAANNWQSLFSGFSITNAKGFYQPSNVLAQYQNTMAQWKTFTFAKGTDLGQSFNALQNNPNVEFVAPNYRFNQNALPNDLDSQLWGLKNTGQTGGTAGADIDAEAGWEYATDASNVLVAVIDTGIDYTHPELQNNIWTNPGEIAGNGIDDDGNGYIDDVHGYDFADNDSDPIDVVNQGHGTHVAGTIAAEGNNGSNITGVAWKAKLMAVKIFADESPYAYTSDIVNGILYAADMGAKVSNNSWGAFFTDSVAADVVNRPIFDAVSYANDAGMLFVAAAGNDYADLDATMQYPAPAGYKLPNVISVAATDHNDELAGFSNRGYAGADIAAPGVDVLSTFPGNDYKVYNGTSMATPHVAGAAALLYSQIEDLTPGEAKAIIVNNAEGVASLDGEVVSGGRLNLKNILEAAQGEAAAGGACDSFTGTAISHYSAGRAGYCPGSYINICANGSGENIGTSFGSTQVTLFETAPGYFETTDNCQEPVSINYPPVLVVESGAEQHIPLDGTVTTPVVTAVDREDGDITSSIIIGTTGPIDVNTAGEYHMTYSVIDSEGKAAAPVVVTINVHAEDQAPSMSFYGEVCTFFWCAEHTMLIGDTWEEPGYVAWDVLDGELTNQVVSTEGDIDNTKQGLYAVHYRVEDSSGNYFDTREQFGFRVVVVHDQNKPFVYMYHPFKSWAFGEDTSVITTYKRPGESYELTPYFYVSDYIDETFAQEQLVVEGVADLTTVGSYQFSVTATDSQGYSSTGTQTIVVVEDTQAPVGNLIGPAVDSVEIGSGYYPDPGVLVSDDLDLSPGYLREGDVDVNTEGTYVLTYTPKDGAGNEGTQLTRTVNVVRSHWNHPPTLWSLGSQTGVGSSNVTYEVFDIDDDVTAMEIRVDGGDWVSMGTMTDIGDHKVRAVYAITGVGVHTYSVRATDSQGNQIEAGEYTARVKLSNNPPMLENVVLTTDGLTVTITGNVTDVDNNQDRLAVYSYGGIEITCEGLESFTCTGTATAAGEYRVRLRAHDTDGNASSYFDEFFNLEEPVVVCFTATTTEHINAGRAEQCGSIWSPSACAIGSGDNLGSASTWFPATASVQETSPGYWVKVSACP